MEIDRTMVYGMQRLRGLAAYDASSTIPLFQDGFESGDSSMWSELAP
jgi:hypothetical protein